MNIESLRILIEVSRYGSFAETARARDLDPSNVSRTVKQVEEQAGIRIFRRSTRNLSLTEAGKTFLTSMSRLVDEYDAALEGARCLTDVPTGTLRLTASVAFAEVMLVPLLPEFRSRFPEIGLELISDDRNVDMIHYQIDLAIRLAPELSGDFICTRLMDTGYAVYARPDYSPGGNRLEHPSDLSRIDVVRQDIPEYRDSWFFRNHRADEGEVRVNGSLIFSNPLNMRQAIIRGTGPGLLAEWLARDSVAAGDLKNLFPDFEFTATSFDTAAWLVYPDRNWLPAKTRVAIDFLKEKLA